jgi:hypothetical protein
MTTSTGIRVQLSAKLNQRNGMKFKKLLATAITMSLPVMAFAGTTEYDGIWDFHFECVARKGVWGKSILDSNDSKIENGQGHFLLNGPRYPATLDVAFTDHHVAVVRVSRATTEVVNTWRWVLKADGDLVDNDKFQISGVSWPQGVDGGVASDCVITGKK